LISLMVGQFGILAPLIPVAFVVTAVRRSRYALLTGTAVLITCFFNASYVNADISRYYVGPALMAWTWLAIGGGTIVDVLVRAAPPTEDAGSVQMRGALIAGLIGIALVVPTLGEVPARFHALDMSSNTTAAAWTD